MKVISYSELLDLPEGTIYSYWTPCYSYGLFRKGETLGSLDHLEENFMPGADDPESPVAMDGCYSRNGTYDPTQRVAVYERPELLYLQDAVRNALAAAAPE